jgi:hypothetical protein
LGNDCESVAEGKQMSESEMKAELERKAKREKETPADKSARSTARATWWIAGFTIILAVTSMLQWCEIHSGSRDTHKLAEATLAASRAWVVVQGTGFGFTKDKNFPSARVVLADSGDSPAFGVEGWRCVEIRGDEPPMQNSQLQKSLTAVCLPIAGGTLGKGVPITMNAFIPAEVPTDFSQDTEGSGSHFYYWGTITYDIYPFDGKRHSTSFCLKNGGDQLSACHEGGYQAD